MAETKYQILYRYVNPNTKKVITNKTLEKYSEVFEFYHNQHKIEIGTDEEKITLMAERDQMIIDSNDSSNPKFDMLFRYAGTKRRCKKVWVPDQLGYVVRNTTGIKVSPIGDYTGDYVYVGGNTPESAKVVAKPGKVNFKDGETFCTSSSRATGYDGPTVKVGSSLTKAVDTLIAAPYFTSEDVRLILNDFTIFNIKETSLGNPAVFLSPVEPIQRKITNGKPETDRYAYKLYGTTYTNELRVAPYDMAVLKGDTQTYTISASLIYPTYSTLQKAQNSCSNALIIHHSDLETMTIPGHFEDLIETPYIMCDSYEKINLSPWFSFCTTSSLTDAIEKAKKLVESIGLENVQVIKLVPIDQFVKIK